MKAAKQALRSGIYAAAFYVVIVVAVFALIAANTKPDNVGLDWIPFVMLAMPWYRLNPQLLIPGLIANAVILFLLGTLLDWLMRYIFRRKRLQK